MLIDLKGINVFLLVLFIITDSSRLSEQIEITRGDQDIFDNPKCSGGDRCNCDGLGAFCVTGSCARCKCKSPYKTFLSSIGDHGRCVKDYYVLFLPDVWKSSFLVEEKHKKLCIGRYDSNDRLGTVNCNLTDSSQRWIWTHYNQLLLVNTFKCLKEILATGLGDRHHSALGECEAKESKQRWKCDGNVFRAETSNWFMGYALKYMFVSNDSQKFSGFLWHRFQSHKSLCSEAFGCYEFANPSSTILVLNTNCKQQCQGNRVINIPYQARQSKCNIFIVEEKLQFWDYDDWKQLPVIEKPFWITKTNNDTSLQWDLTSASQKWSGLIVRLRFYCKQRLISPPPQNTSCIVIKFEGVCNNTTSPPPSPILPTTTFDQSTTVPDTTDRENIRNKSKTTTFGQSTTFPDTTDREKQRNKSKTTKGFMIGAYVVIPVLVLGACIFGLIFYKRRSFSHPVQESVDTNAHEMQNCDITQNSSNSTNEDVLRDYEPLKREDINDEHIYQGLSKPSAEYVINPLTVPSSEQEVQYYNISNDPSTSAYEEPSQNYEQLRKNRRDTEDTKHIYQGLK